MSYQVRHSWLGIFQGVELTVKGAAVCYHPAADNPEMGVCEFPTEEAANTFIRWMLSVHSLGYKADELTVEPYNKEVSDAIQQRGIHYLTLEHWARLLKINE